MGSNWIAVATNLNYIRFLSLTGLQTLIFSIEGDIVAMRGQEQYLFIVYHQGVPIDGILIYSYWILFYFILF